MAITKIQFAGSMVFSIKGLSYFFPCFICLFYLFISTSTSCIKLQPASHIHIQLYFSSEIIANHFNLIKKSSYENYSVQECIDIGFSSKVIPWSSSLDINVYFYFKHKSALQFPLIWVHICKTNCKTNEAL